MSCFIIPIVTISFSHHTCIMYYKYIYIYIYILDLQFLRRTLGSYKAYDIPVTFDHSCNFLPRWLGLCFPAMAVGTTNRFQYSSLVKWRSGKMKWMEMSMILSEDGGCWRDLFSHPRLLGPPLIYKGYTSYVYLQHPPAIIADLDKFGKSWNSSFLKYFQCVILNDVSNRPRKDKIGCKVSFWIPPCSSILEKYLVFFFQV